MALTDYQRRQISGNIKRLDYLSGTGVLNDKKKEMVRELFLIISAGGVGGKALREIKRTVMQQIDEKDVENQIMFICADTAHNELDQMAGNELKEEEILKIPYEGAKQVIQPGKMSPTTKKWVHPGLYDIVSTKSGFMDGTGASALRQCGRVMFAQAESQDRLFARLSGIKQKAARMTEEGIANVKLKVIFLAGIAGGTGSGTIIDLGFLTRHYLKSILPGWEDRTNFSAYLFLPSACGTPDTPADGAKGDQNAYAALKEIDYFMDLKSLKESFRMDYGTPSTYNMVIQDNLFDFCTLVEGIGGGGTMFGNPAETARKITALTLMNILCATESNQVGADSVFMVDSFLSNAFPQSMTKLGLHSDRVWPREANYHFDVIGYAACVVPVDLLTVYAFKKVFDQIYHVFKNYSQATAQMAQSFLQQCGLDLKTVERNYNTLTPQAVSANIENTSARLFKQYGPYFMINLTKQAVDLITEPTQGYIAQARQKLGGFMPNTRKWNFIINLYSFVADQLIKKNNSLYDVYTFVIDEMQKLLQENAGILTESSELKSKFGYSFYWTPVDLTKGQGAAFAVTRYLDGIMNPQRASQLAFQFVEQMYAQQGRWTALAPREEGGVIPFDVADEIRGFIQHKMNDIVGKTLEDFIVMAYSGDPQARPSEKLPDGTEVPTKATKTAAQTILGRLSTSAVPLASVRSDFHLPECYHNIYLTIPAKCHWLHQAIIELAPTYHLLKENIFLSSANDSIVWSNRYAGVPAWALRWTSGAEAQYEAVGPNSIGLHIEQGSGGRKWADLPNLYPEGLWTADERRIRQREAAISKSVRDDMKEALDKGLVIPHADLFQLTRFAQGETADTLWDSLSLTDNQKYTPAEMYSMLRQAGKAQDVQVECVGFVTIDPDIIEQKDKEKYAYDLSCRVVRKNSRERKDLTRTLEIARELEARLEERNRGCVDLSSLMDFVDALKWDLFTYEGYSGQWSINLETEVPMGSRIGDKLGQQCAHFCGYGRYLQLDEETLQQIKAAIAQKNTNPTPEIFKAQHEKAAALKQSIHALRTAKLPTDSPWKQDSPFAIAGNRSPWPMGKIDFPETAKQMGYNGEDIRSFYKSFENFL